MEYYLVITENKTLPFVITCICLDGIMLSQAGSGRQILNNLTYVWNPRNKTSEH